MALASVSDALTQFNANANWYGSKAAAQLRLEAIEFLQTQRGQQMSDQSTTLNYEALESQAKTLRSFLGAGAPRGFGRSRFLQSRYPAVEGAA